MLTFAEEVLLLSHDESRGQFFDLPMDLTGTALAGAVLMDLALHNRIDTDVERLILVDARPTGEALLDGVLMQIATAAEALDTDAWLERLQAQGGLLFNLALARLVERGILRIDSHRVLWVFESRRYPLVDSEPQQEVKQRIRALLRSNDIPDIRDLMIVALAEACGLLERVLPAAELESAAPRIRQIVRLDLIGHSIRATIRRLQTAMIDATGYASVR
jgi:hypothetical protein